MAKSYKWELRKGSQKEICPQCGKRRFVPYVLAADGKTMAGAEYGRCDREQNCGYSRYPTQSVSVKAVAMKDVQEHKNAPYVFDRSCVVVKHSTLLDYAMGLVGCAAYEIWDRYRIGAARDGRTIFWYIDKNGIVRSGKEIKYMPNGHRDKTAFPPVTWAHKDCDFFGHYTGDELLQPFFGEHLLATADKNAKVAIVESEKTAAMMSAFYPKCVWLACGGSQGIKNEEKNKALKGRKVVLIPDHGQYYSWKVTADKYGWDIFDFTETQPLFEGCDILDYYDNANKQFNETHGLKQ